MLDTLVSLLVGPFAEFEFMRRALVGILALALGGGPLGVFLMLRRMSLTGDAMAHAILPGAAIGYLVSGLSLGAMTVGGLAAGFTVAILSGIVTRTTRLTEDASLAGFYLISLALGVMIISLRGSSIDLLHVLFGSVLALDDGTLILIASVASLTLAALAVIFRPLVLECVDPTFLRSVSRAGGPVHILFLALVVLNLIGGFYALGTLLAVGMMMLPAIAAQFWTRDLSATILIAILIGFAGGVAGLLISYHLGTASGPSIVVTIGALYLLSMALGTQGGFAWRLLPRRHFRA